MWVFYNNSTWVCLDGYILSREETWIQKSTSEREITALQEQVSLLRDETTGLKKQMRELIQIAKGIAE